jgi:hypothetical protein
MIPSCNSCCCCCCKSKSLGRARGGYGIMPLERSTCTYYIIILLQHWLIYLSSLIEVVAAPALNLSYCCSTIDRKYIARLAAGESQQAIILRLVLLYLRLYGMQCMNYSCPDMDQQQNITDRCASPRHRMELHVQQQQQQQQLDRSVNLCRKFLLH